MQKVFAISSILKLISHNMVQRRMSPINNIENKKAERNPGLLRPYAVIESNKMVQKGTKCGITFTLLYFGARACHPCQLRLLPPQKPLSVLPSCLCGGYISISPSIFSSTPRYYIRRVLIADVRSTLNPTVEYVIATR